MIKSLMLRSSRALLSSQRSLVRPVSRFGLRLLVCAFVASTALSCLPTLEGQNVVLWGQQVRFTFLLTTDIHSRLLPYDFAPAKTDVDLGLIPEVGPFGGITRMGAVIKRERHLSERVLHLDSGDSFEGAPIFNINHGEVEYKWLSQMRCDAAVLGNHEFDAGADNFAKQAKDNADFPILVANYFWDSDQIPGSNQTNLYTQPYTIKNVQGVKVGVIGLGNLSSLDSIVYGGNSLQITPLEQNEAIRSYVELLKPVVDLVVVVSHAGLTEDQNLIQGYDAYYEYDRVKNFLERPDNQWQVIEWFGPEKDPKSVVHVQIPGVSGIDIIFGGHLHVVLNPPQILTDPSGRHVLLSHNGAFAKYVGRMDVVLQMPSGPGTTDGAEILSHTYRVFPLDSLWCDDALHQYYTSQFWNPGQFVADPLVQAGVKKCAAAEDSETAELLLPYITDLDFELNLTSLFGYAPQDIQRRNSSSGGDSPLGNLCADSMRKRKTVEAEVALTNSLGIRDNLYAGPLSQESMFNVFPFENTINIMFLSGLEMQELLDFNSEKSADRGCVSQSQVAGMRFTMDCAQVQLNQLLLPCDLTKPHPELDCPQDNRDGRAPWACQVDTTGQGRCWAHEATDITINGQPLDAFSTYRIAVNDYIAKGGSGFLVLKRNTSRIETGIPLRESLIGYMQSFCNCNDVLAGKKDQYGNVIGANGQLCGQQIVDGLWPLDPGVVSYCTATKAFEDVVKNTKSSNCNCINVFQGTCGTQTDVNTCVQALPPGPNLGKCTCRDALAGASSCGHVTSALKLFCETPTGLPVSTGIEDGRIGRRVK